MKNSFPTHKYFIIVLLVFISNSIYAQTHEYVIYLRNKPSMSLSNPNLFLSSKSIQRKKNQSIQIDSLDLPVKKELIDSLIKTGIKIKGVSKWKNAVLISGTEEQIERCKQKLFVKNYLQIATKYNSCYSNITEVYDYGKSKTHIDMHNLANFHEKGYTGKGVLMAILDGGFGNTHLYSHLYPSKILETYDFVSKDSMVYDDHSHGAEVLSVIASKKEGLIFGSAPDLDVILYRTENVDTESLAEEFYWLMAAEKADSAGADIISSSLGYNTFDNPAFDHRYAELDGKTTLITWAANTAFEKGILVVTSAGNEGAKSWKYITAPADSKSAITVGAVDKDRLLVSFSSIGPTADGRIKPDVVSMGSGVYTQNKAGVIGTNNGTSFSAPFIAGILACMKQANPLLSNESLSLMLKNSSSNASSPSNTIGYGIPDASKILKNLSLTSDSKETEIYYNSTENLLISSINATSEFKFALLDSQGNILKQWSESKNVGNSNTFELPTFKGLCFLQMLVNNKTHTLKIFQP